MRKSRLGFGGDCAKNSPVRFGRSQGHVATNSTDEKNSARRKQGRAVPEAAFGHGFVGLKGSCCRIKDLCGRKGNIPLPIWSWCGLIRLIFSTGDQGGTIMQ